MALGYPDALGQFITRCSDSYIRFQFLGYGFKLHILPDLPMAILGVFIVSRIMKLLNGLHAVSYLPGMRIPFQPFAVPGVILPTTWWNPSMSFGWAWKSHLYKHFQSENVSFVPFMFGNPTICTSNLDVVRQVAVGGQNTRFGKPLSANLAVLKWGMNLFAADGETWRKHRRIIGPAFNNDLYQMVWSETLTTYYEMMSEEGWTTTNAVEVPIVQKLTFKLALLTIAKCGFGLSFNWSAPPTAPNGGMTVQEAFHVVGSSYLLFSLVPKWLMWLPFRKLRETRQAHKQLTEFMRGQALDRKKEIRGRDIAESDRKDIFTMLVRANETEEGKFRLDDDELVGNIFIMLLAGHETTAHSLAVTIGFLSLHPDIQEEAREQIHTVVGHDMDPVFEDYAKLDKVLAVFYEALRLVPPVYVMIREAKEDTVLQIPNPVGVEGNTTVPVQKGVWVIVDMIGVQYNPRYFDEPEVYRPSRWYGVTNDSEAFSAFSVGPRACVGRKFATTGAVAFLTMLLRDWDIEPILQHGETKQEWRNRVLDGKILLTLGVKDVPVKFTKRAKN